MSTNTWEWTVGDGRERTVKLASGVAVNVYPPGARLLVNGVEVPDGATVNEGDDLRLQIEGEDAGLPVFVRYEVSFT